MKIRITLQSVRQTVRMMCFGLWAQTHPGGGDLEIIIDQQLFALKYQ